MRAEVVQIQIRTLLTQFVQQVKGATAQGDTFLNKLAETILLPLLREVYELPNLTNLNYTQKANFPAIDLADFSKRVAIQITSTPTSDKVKSTLSSFVEHNLHKHFDRLIIYIIAEKQTRYSGSKYDDFIQDKLSFDKEKDIADYTDVLTIVSGFPLERAERILKLLENSISDTNNVTISRIPQAPQLEHFESVFLNLLSMKFPASLYIAELTVDRKEVIRQSNNVKSVKINRESHNRDIARAALELRGLPFALDWVAHDNKIITFHDLNQTDLPLHQIIDPGTIDNLPTSSFHSIDHNYDRVFKDLLRRCLQQLLYRRSIQWQHEEKLFIFVRTDGDVRTEHWYGTTFPTRTVYECKRNKDNPDKIKHHVHFGFRTSFKQFGKEWYLAVNPDWFVSRDGYNKSSYGSEFINYKKRKENNQHINTHARFIAHFLKHHHAGLFDEKDHEVYPFLSFGEYADFDNAPLLDDSNYLPKGKKQQEQDEFIQRELL